jgi:hypothetical protein
MSWKVQKFERRKVARSWRRGGVVMKGEREKGRKGERRRADVKLGEVEICIFVTKFEDYAEVINGGIEPVIG